MTDADTKISVDETAVAAALDAARETVLDACRGRMLTGSCKSTIAPGEVYVDRGARGWSVFARSSDTYQLRGTILLAANKPTLEEAVSTALQAIEAFAAGYAAIDERRRVAEARATAEALRGSMGDARAAEALGFSVEPAGDAADAAA